MSIAAKLGIEVDLHGSCEDCGRKNMIVKRWGDRGKDKRRAFVCVDCAGKDDRIYKAMKEMFLFGELP
jgi:hypothetical protein